MRKAGERSQFVRIVEPVAGTPDEYGHCDTVDVEIGDGWAAVRQTGGTESAGPGDQTQAGASWTVEMPWPCAIPERAAVVLESGRRLEILNVENVDDGDYWAILTCGESR